MERLVRIGVNSLKNKAEEKIRPFAVESILTGTPIDRPVGYDIQIIDLIHSGTNWPVILGSHKAHPAGFPPMEEAEYLRNISKKYLPYDEQFLGSTILMANTMQNGQADAVVQGLRETEPIISKLNAQPLFVYRQKDLDEAIAKKPDHFADLNAEFAKNSSERKRVLGNLVKNRRIPILLPEGTVESGRQKPGGYPGEINGMVNIQPRSIDFLVHFLERQGKEPVFIFMGTTGENTIYDPITQSFPEETLQIAKRRVFPPIRRFIRHPMKSIVDYPTPYSDIIKAFGENGRLPKGLLEEYCGQRLAQLLPPNERGSVYNEPTLLEASPQILRRDTSYLFKK